MNDPSFGDAEKIREIVTWVVVGLGGIAGSSLIFIRRWSGVKLGGARDSDETTVMGAKNQRIAVLEEEIRLAYKERNDAMRELGTLSASVKYLTEMQKDSREELLRSTAEIRRDLMLREAQVDELQRQLASKLDKNSAKLDYNTQVTEKGAHEAHVAIETANNFNEKLENLNVLQLETRTLAAAEIAKKAALDKEKLESIDATGLDTNLRVRKLTDDDSHR